MSNVLERLRERRVGSTHWVGCEDSHVDCAAVLEIERLRRELAEARAALVEVEHLAATIENAWYRPWCEQHAAALKAAREVSNGNP